MNPPHFCCRIRLLGAFDASRPSNTSEFKPASVQLRRGPLDRLRAAEKSKMITSIYVPERGGIRKVSCFCPAFLAGQRPSGEHAFVLFCYLFFFSFLAEYSLISNATEHLRVSVL